jgi:predicted Zn-dependent protease
VVDTATPLELLPAEWELLSIVDGNRTVRDLAEALRRSEFEVARTIYGLATAGIILLEDPTRQAMEAAGRVDLTVLLGEIERLMSGGNPEAARQVAQQATETHPDQPLAHLAHGTALLAAGHAVQAAEALRHAVHLDPHSAPAHRLLGVALAGSGQFREAVQAVNQWAQLVDKPPEEEAQSAMVERVRDAAMTLDMVLRGLRD